MTMNQKLIKMDKYKWIKNISFSINIFHFTIILHVSLSNMNPKKYWLLSESETNTDKSIKTLISKILEKEYHPNIYKLVSISISLNLSYLSKVIFSLMKCLTKWKSKWLTISHTSINSILVYWT